MSARRASSLAFTTAALAAVGPAALIHGYIARSARPHLVSLDDAPAGWPALVLGARLRDDGAPSRALGDRLVAARALAARDPTRPLWLTGTPDEVAAMSAWLLAAGVAAERVATDAAGLRTWDSMLRARAVFGEATLLVVTNPFHIARATWLARAAGLEALGVPAPQTSGAVRTRDRAREVAARVRAFADVALAVPPAVDPRDARV